ncbi:hemolymph lipopolysaccharide-binding protein [Diachasma alloeum]|uniref:hemolymph lipopolysaccharide-binding protein n=1 Tax=Diachasma alloeum TaxID=454923 RepID=UPI0007381B0B|nr:hemolymph lipopolysaccharide-binding protein [Diachasma alloeum]
MQQKQIVQILTIILSLSITIVLTAPVNNVTDNVMVEDLRYQDPTPSTSSPPCQNYAHHNSVPQLVFPTCMSSSSPEGLRNVVIHGMACACDLNTHDVQKRDDYYYTVGIGAHKLHTRGATFNNARKVCIEEGGHLAVIDSVAEEQVLLDLFKRSGPMRNVSQEEQAFIGIHDLFAEGEWVTVLGDSLYKYGYTKWSNRWDGQPDNGGGVQHCGTLLKEGEMDDVNCNIQLAFFCEMPGIRLAH